MVALLGVRKSRRTFMNKVLVLAAMGFILAGCGGNKTYVKKGELERTINEEAVKRDYIEAIRIGAADSTLTNKTQRLATSRNAAVVGSQYQMLSLIKGIDLE